MLTCCRVLPLIHLAVTWQTKLISNFIAVPMVAAKIPEDVETGSVGGVAVTVEPPGATDTSAWLYWHGREDFDRCVFSRYNSSHVHVIYA